MTVGIPFFLSPSGSDGSAIAEIDDLIQATGNLPTTIGGKFAAAQPAGATITVSILLLEASEHAEVPDDVWYDIAVIEKVAAVSTEEVFYGNIYATGYMSNGLDSDIKAPPLFSGKIKIACSWCNDNDGTVPDISGKLFIA